MTLCNQAVGFAMMGNMLGMFGENACRGMHYVELPKQHFPNKADTHDVLALDSQKMQISVAQ